MTITTDSRRERRCAEAAVSFLLGARDEQGWWRDFNAQGPSDLWVTGYVAAALVVTQQAESRAAAVTAWNLLKEAQRGGGWSYHPRTPPDSDSTTWALRVAETVGAGASQPATDGYALLDKHVTADGGLATYAMAVAGETFARFDFIESWAGWLAPHPCVTAAAANLAGWSQRDRLLAYLSRTQHADGSWSAYWWHDREYTTALAAEALAARGGFDRNLTAAARWAAHRIGASGAVRTDLYPDGSPFATALAARALAREPNPSAGHRATLQRALDWLTQAQRPDGGWQPSARMRIVPPGVLDPDAYPDWGMDGVGRESVGTIVVDTHGVFTTATVLAAFAGSLR